MPKDLWTLLTSPEELREAAREEARMHDVAIAERDAYKELADDALQCRTSLAEKDEQYDNLMREREGIGNKLGERTAERDALVEFLKQAMTDSNVTGGTYGGPGCFFCDTEEGHSEHCGARALLAEIEAD